MNSQLNLALGEILIDWVQEKAYQQLVNNLHWCESWILNQRRGDNTAYSIVDVDETCTFFKQPMKMVSSAKFQLAMNTAKETK